MEPYAEASCVLKVNVHCQACKMRILEVVGSIIGQYNVDINAEEGLVKVYAMVNPNILLKALARTGYHAELKWVKLTHPKMSPNYYYDNDYDSSSKYGYGYNYGALDDTYSYRRALPDPYSYSGHPNHYYSNTSSLSPYNSGYYYGSGLPPARSSYACRRPRPFAF